MVREELIAEVAFELNVDKKVVEAVISNQFRGLLGAMKTNNSVELSGIGKFLWKKKTEERRLNTLDLLIARCHRQLVDEAHLPKRVEKIKKVMSETMNKKKILIDRINVKSESDIRRMEEQFAPKGIDEGINNSDIK